MTGSGTEADPYVVLTLLDLDEVRNNLTAYYRLDANIDASETSSWDSGSGFEPIGSSGDSFRGHFDGNGHTISGLYIDRSATDYVGLFGYVANTYPSTEVAPAQHIKNLTLEGCDITGAMYTGALAGYAYYGYPEGSTDDYQFISGCSASGTVAGGSYSGGLVGYLEVYQAVIV